MGVRFIDLHGAGTVSHWTGFDHLPSREGVLVGVVLFTRVTLPPCGYCLKASMTGRVCCLIHPLLPCQALGQAV